MGLHTVLLSTHCWFLCGLDECRLLNVSGFYPASDFFLLLKQEDFSVVKMHRYRIPKKFGTRIKIKTRKNRTMCISGNTFEISSRRTWLTKFITFVFVLAGCDIDNLNGRHNPETILESFLQSQRTDFRLGWGSVSN